MIHRRPIPHSLKRKEAWLSSKFAAMSEATSTGSMASSFRGRNFILAERKSALIPMVIWRNVGQALRIKELPLRFTRLE